jgi:hypothetical protein
MILEAVDAEADVEEIVAQPDYTSFEKMTALSRPVLLFPAKVVSDGFAIPLVIFIFSSPAKLYDKTSRTSSLIESVRSGRT